MKPADPLRPRWDRVRATARALWQRDQDPVLDGLRWRLHLRLLRVAALIGVLFCAVRFHFEGSFQELPGVPVSALLAWAWLRDRPQHQRTTARVVTGVFLLVALIDLGRRPHETPWALFAMMVLPAYSTLLDGLVAGGLATLTTLAAVLWIALHSPPSDPVLAYFAGLSSVCFYFICLAFTWIFGALVSRRRLSQLAVDQAGRGVETLARTLADEVTLTTARLRASLESGLDGLGEAKDLQAALARTRADLPRDLPASAVDPERHLERQFRAVHRIYLLLAMGVSAVAGLVVLAFGQSNAWLGGAVALITGLLAAWERGWLPWRWRLRVFLAMVLACMATDMVLSGPHSPAASLVFLPMLIFYSGILDRPVAGTVTTLLGLALLELSAHLQAGILGYAILMVVLQVLCLASLAFAWSTQPAYRGLLKEMADQEQTLRSGLHAYRRLVSTLFHDLANPLAVLLTLAALPANLRQADDLERAKRMVERLRSLTAAARQAAEPGAGPAHAGSQSLSSLVAALRDLFKERLATRRLELRMEGASDAALPASALHLEERVFGHLVSNAVRYSPEGGRITLRAERIEHGWLLSVLDQGPGIPTDVLRDLLHESAPTPRPDHAGDLGSGYGLLLAQAYARDLGGMLEIRNVPTAPGGTEAVLYLPGA